MAKKKNNHEVVKSNRLIEASYRLTLAEQRMVLMAIAEARRAGQNLRSDTKVTIRAKDYAALVDMPLNQAYVQIREAAGTLFQRFVILYDIHPESGEERKSMVRWVSAVSYVEGAGLVQLQFAHDMIPYISRLEAEFTRYNLEKISKLTSAHAVRLYELLIQWNGVGEREIEIDWLKKTLMVEDEYPRLDNFKRWVIDVAVAQINEHTDLKVTYSQRKTGRKVTHLIFTFKRKREAALPKQEPKSTEKKSKPTRKFIEENALPGETWEQAEARLRGN